MRLGGFCICGSRDTALRNISRAAQSTKYRLDRLAFDEKIGAVPFRTIGVVSPLAPTQQFDTLPEHEKKRILFDGLGANILHSGLKFAVPLWWLYTDSSNTIALRNGSACLLDLGQGAFVATAAHVFREYCSAKRTAAGIGCQLASLLFDPEARLIACRDDPDIATFEIAAEEVA
jgi:hypothetical protein